MLMSVTERFREIGTMKCMGALDGFIVKLFLLESSFMGTAGTLLGVIVGLLLSVGLSYLTYGSAMFPHIRWVGVFESAGISMIIGASLSLFGGIIPAYRAAKMEPVDAMALEV